MIRITPLDDDAELVIKNCKVESDNAVAFDIGDGVPIKVENNTFVNLGFQYPVEWWEEQQ